MIPLETSRRTQRVRHETRRRDVEVLRVEPVGRSYVRVSFTGESLADFVSSSFDDHIKFIFEDARGQPVKRDYTPADFDRDRRILVVEFALHGHGGASEWARQAVPGQRAAIAGPRGSMIIPNDYDWHLLAGDSTALPAITRRVRELAPGCRAFVVVQVEHPADRRELDSSALLDVRWVENEQRLLSEVQALKLPPGDGFAWAAGESSVMTRLREQLIQDKMLHREQLRIAAYWKRGAADYHQNLDDERTNQS
jgi:NADPH-dependent ferric siderophore reductase